MQGRVPAKRARVNLRLQLHTGQIQLMQRGVMVTSLARRLWYLCDQRAGHLEQVLPHGHVEGGVSALPLGCVDFGSALHQQAEAALAVPPHGEVERMKT